MLGKSASDKKSESASKLDDSSRPEAGQAYEGSQDSKGVKNLGKREREEPEKDKEDAGEPEKDKEDAGEPSKRQKTEPGEVGYDGKR